MIDHAPRITRALDHWDTTLADTGVVFWPNVLPSVALSLQRVLLAAGHLHDAVEAELPPLLARLAAAEMVIARYKATQDSYQPPLDERHIYRQHTLLDTAIAAYDAHTPTASIRRAGRGRVGG